jgi:hypothetical protein
MFAPALGWDIADGALEYFEQCLLNAFAGDIAGDGIVFGFASDFVDFIHVNDAALGAFDIEVRSLQQAKHDVLYVLAHIASFGKGCGIHDAEWDIEHLGE